MMFLKGHKAFLQLNKKQMMVVLKVIFVEYVRGWEFLLFRNWGLLLKCIDKIPPFIFFYQKPPVLLETPCI